MLTHSYSYLQLRKTNIRRLKFCYTSLSASLLYEKGPFLSRSRQEMRESNFEMQITNLNKEKAALRSQLDQTLEELMQV